MGAEFWTDERVEEAKRRFRLGESASTIAKAIGARNRGTVTMKLRRCGLRRGDTTTHTKPTRPPIRIATPAPLATPAQALAAGVAFHALAPACCKWPLDDPGPGQMDWMICCAVPTGDAGQPYCPAHTRAAWNKPRVTGAVYTRAQRRFA